MAKLIPPKFPFPNDPMRKAEHKFYKACREQLDNDWHVLYNVSWTGPRNGHNDDCDSDFLLIHPRFGLFTVEVKGGQRIWVENGSWFTQPHGNFDARKIKDPAVQASESKRFLYSFITRNADVRLNGSFGHMVVFPGHTQVDDMAPHLPRRIICDSDDLNNLSEKLTDIANYWNQKHQFDEDAVKRIVDSLIPSFQLIGASRLQVDEVEHSLRMLTNAQLEVWSMLDDVKKLIVTGGAGTGKTVLAFNKAITLANRGFKVLYLCATDGLAHSLHDQLSNSHDSIKTKVFIVSEETFSSAISREIQSGRELDSDIEIECMVQALNRLNSQVNESIDFDAVIVDEAQSVSARIYELFSIFRATQSCEYIFGDHFQDWNDDSVLAATNFHERKTLTINCRSTGEISQYAADFIGRREESGQLQSVNGPEVTAAFTSRQGVVADVASIVKEWMLEYAVSEDEIVILCDNSFQPELSDDFGETPRGITTHESFGIDWRSSWDTFDVWSPPTWKISRKNRDSQTSLNAATSKEITKFITFRDSFPLPLIQVCPISRFLGLESLAVLVVTGMSNPAGIANPARVESDMYVACSRARSILGLVVVLPS
ncbi:MAG: NERD domain-containing protein [Acidimicrobiaceae bacterium]|nr:NERD domain-containing protein [Ilumatobacteraceae bacterium]